MPKMHQNTFDGRAPPGPAGELKCSPDPLAAIRRPTSQGGKESKEKGRKRRGKGGRK